MVDSFCGGESRAILLYGALSARYVTWTDGCAVRQSFPLSRIAYLLAGPPLSQMVAAIVALCALVACGHPPVPLTVEGPTALSTMTIQPVQTPLERVVDGTVEAVNQATVSAQTAGRVSEILFDVNDVVPAGAVIMRLKSMEQRASLAVAQAVLNEARIRHAEAATSYQRIADIYKSHLVSKSQFDQATANRDAAAARLSAAEAGITAANEGLSYTEVRAPYGGVVTKRLVEVGEAVRPGTPLMTGASLKDLRVNTYVPERVLVQVRSINKAAVYIGDQRIEATRLTIFPEAATTTGTFRARLDFPAGALTLAPGVYVRVGLVIGQGQQIVVPISAVVEQSEVTAVYVVDIHHVPSLRYIRPGRRVGDHMEVLAGLLAGERIATDPSAARSWLSAEPIKP